MIAMSGPPISASERRKTEFRTARNAGWSRSDLIWERMQERANLRLAAGQRLRSAAGFFLADWLALFRFDPADIRRAASTANAAFAFRLLGMGFASSRFYRSACREWKKTDRELTGIAIVPRARSSLFHLRMEARHSAEINRNRKRRLAAFIQESGECLEHLERKAEPPHRLFSRWAGEKPPVFDDTRKILAACLLIASAPQAEQHPPG